MRIKEKPSDFKVKELSNIKFETRGKYVYLLLRKEGWNTLSAIGALSKEFMISRKNFGFAGLKDKQAITEQYISVHGVKKEKLKTNLKGLNIEIVGRGKKPISLGDLKGNKFEIFVSGEKINDDGFFINYFGEQRFGKWGKNILVGKAILKRDFKEACNLLELNIKDNFLGNLKSLGKKRLSLYLHAYQSYLWNLLVKDMIKKVYPSKIGNTVGDYVFLNERTPNFRVPLPNFDIDVYDEYLEKDGLKKESFILREIPELVSETVFRDIMVEVDNFDLKEQDNGYLVKFALPKGSYATVYLKKLFK